jgi:hypothetical protein
MDENQIYYLGRVEKNTIVLKQNNKASRFDGNIKKVGFRSGQRALNNIYLDFYDSNNSKTSLAFTTDGENAIKFLVNDEEKWKVVVK